MRILKIFPIQDDPFKVNYDINYGVWDSVDGDEVCLETFDSDLNEYDVVFLPMYSRWARHTDLLNRIKDHKIKTVLFDNDSCYRLFSDEFYEGMDYIFYRGLDEDGQCPANGSQLLWSVNHRKFTPVYGGSGVSFSSSVNMAYPLRKEIDKFIEHSDYTGIEYIENLQDSAAAIHTNSEISLIVRGKVLEFAACGTQIISNIYMSDYFPDELIVHFDSVDHLKEIVKDFVPDIEIQKRLRAIVEEKHTNEIRARQILEKL